MADLGAVDYRARYWPRTEQSEGYEFYRAVLAEKIPRLHATGVVTHWAWALPSNDAQLCQTMT